MTKGRVLSALHPFGPLSPFHPSNPLNPMRLMGVVRTPPAGDLGDDHGSLLKRIYGDVGLEAAYGGRENVDDLAMLCTESWRSTIECLAEGNGLDNARLSIVSHVQFSRVPLLGQVSRGCFVVRNRDTGQTWSQEGLGELHSGDDLRFKGPSLSVAGKRIDKAWACAIEGRSEGAVLRLDLAHGPIAHLSDTGLPRGWCDNNPEGFVPYWASYRTRNGSGSGELTFPDGRGYRIVAEAKTEARFDHQTFHAPGYAENVSLPAVAESAISRPQCLRYQARLSLGDRRAKVPHLYLVAYEVRNGNTGQVLKRAAFLFDDLARVVAVDRSSLQLKRPGTRKPLVAGTPDLSFEMPDTFRDGRLLEDWGLKGSRFELKFRSTDATTLRYPVADRLRYDVHTCYGRIEGTSRLGAVTGTATREIIDSLRSVTIEV
jgi:hypothetical protein